MKVRAAVARSQGSALRLESLQLSEPQADEILVRVVACGVSLFDLDAIEGRLSIPPPFVPGTEGAGIVERVGQNVSNLAPGDAVILGFDFCGHCERCVSGHPRGCIAFRAHNLAGHRPNSPTPFAIQDQAVNGCFFGQSSFATHALCRASRAIRLPKGAPLEVLACLGGEFLLGAGAVLETLRLQKGDSLVVVGAGPVGLAATMVATALGAGSIVVMEADERLRMLASELGAHAAVHPDENLVDLVRSLEADGAKFAVETTGQADARRACLASVDRDATCAFRRIPGDTAHGVDDRSGVSHRVVRLEDHPGPNVLIPKLVALHARGDLPLEQLVDFFAFEHVNDALDALRGGGVPKPVLRFSIGGFGDVDRAMIEGARSDRPDKVPEPENIDASKPEVVRS